MKILNNERKSKKLIGEKLREARMEDRSPMTEEDAEYYRILAEARINHAEKKNARGYARRRRAANGFLVCLILAVACGGYILSMKADVSASADPDDERKVVQQGDNIVIGSGVSEDDENVGVVTKTYYSLEDVPEGVLEKIIILDNDRMKFLKLVEIDMKSNETFEVTYLDKYENKINVGQKIIKSESHAVGVVLNTQNKRIYNENILYEEKCHDGTIYTYASANNLFEVFIPSSARNIEIEDILDDLID